MYGESVYDKAVAARSLVESAVTTYERSKEKKEVQLNELVEAIEKAEKAGVDENIVNVVHEALRKYAAARRHARFVRCIDSQYDLKNYSGLRELNKTAFSKVRKAVGSSTPDKRLVYQSTVISNSISRLSDEEVQLAIEVNKLILKFVDDTSPTVEKSVKILKNIAKEGSQYPNLIDEIYLQIFKLLGENPNIMSRWRGWILVSYCVLYWPPSVHLQPYVLRFVLLAIDTPDFRSYYGKFCWEKLNDMLDGARIRDCVLPLAILQRYERLQAQPLFVDVEWPTGKLIERVEVNPHLKVGDYVNKFCTTLGLSEEKKQVMGLFLSFAPDKSWRYEPLDMNEYLADIFLARDESRRAKLVLSVRLFLWCSKEVWPAKDRKYEEVLYDQCYRDVIIEGIVQLDTVEAAAQLARIATLVTEGPKAPAENISKYLPRGNMHMFADHEDMNSYFRTHGGVETFKGKKLSALRREFISIVINLPHYDTRWFQVDLRLGRESMGEKVLGINSTAIFVYSTDSVTLPLMTSLSVSSPPEHVFDFKSLTITDGSTKLTTSSISFRFHGVESVKEGVSTMTIKSKKWCTSIRAMVEENIRRESICFTGIAYTSLIE